MAETATAPNLGQPDAATSTGPATNVASDNPTPASQPEFDIDSLTEEQMDAMLTGKDVTIAGGVEAQTPETPTPPPEPEAKPDAGEIPPTPEQPEPETPQPETQTPPTEPKDLRMRLNAFPDVEQEAIKLRRDLLAKGTDISLTECITRTEAKYATTNGAEPEPGVDPVEALQAEVETLQQQLKDKGNDEGLYNSEIADLQIQLTDKVTDLKLAKDKAVTRAENAQASATKIFVEARTVSRNKAVELFPAVADAASPLGARTRELLAELQDPDHPDHNLLLARNAPLFVAQLAATELGVQPVAKAPVASSTPPTVPATASPATNVPRVQPASGSRRTATPTQATSEAQVLAQADTMSLEEMDRLQSGGKPLGFVIR